MSAPPAWPMIVRRPSMVMSVTLITVPISAICNWFACDEGTTAVDEGNVHPAAKRSAPANNPQHGSRVRMGKITLTVTWDKSYIEQVWHRHHGDRSREAG